MTNKTVIISDSAPKAIGPYSQAIKVGQWIYTSGQIPINPATNELIKGDIGAQTRRVIENLMSVLSEAGASLEDVVKTTVFLSDMNDFPEMNNVYAEYFHGEAKPARSTVQVGRLPKDAAVEIEAIAFTGINNR